jgi:hypothetical protein
MRRGIATSLVLVLVPLARGLAGLSGGMRL